MENQDWECYHYTPVRIHVGTTLLFVPLFLFVAMNAPTLERQLIMGGVFVFLLTFFNVVLHRVDSKEPCLRMKGSEFSYRDKNRWRQFNPEASVLELSDKHESVVIKLNRIRHIYTLKPNDYKRFKQQFSSLILQS